VHVGGDLGEEATPLGDRAGRSNQREWRREGLNTGGGQDPKPIAYLTANFLQGGWLHLIGNMWFLWLAGAILEDTWGRVIYPIIYLVAGAAALQFHAWLNPGSLAPTLGASGAVAALMGAFLVRFPKTKIEVALVLGLRSLSNLALGRGIRFKAAAY